MKNRQWRLKERPKGLVGPEHFTFSEIDVNAPRDGQLLVRTLLLSCDPTQRGWLLKERGYVDPVEIGQVMPALGVGQVVESRKADFQKGDVVTGLLAWQDFDRA